MITDLKRRILLKGSMAAGLTGAAVVSGLLTPRAVLAAWPKEAFSAKKEGDAMSALYGSGDAAESAAIKIKAPDIAENGAVVPVTISTDMAGVESMTIIAAENPVPLTAHYVMGEGALGYVSTRIKMGKTGDVVAVVKAGGKLHSARKPVKVTIGGCGG